MPVAGPDSGPSTLFYSFGHTSTAIFLQTASPKVVEQRLPFPFESCRSNSEFEWRISTTWVMNVSAILRFSRCIWAI